MRNRNLFSSRWFRFKFANPKPKVRMATLLTQMNVYQTRQVRARVSRNPKLVVTNQKDGHTSFTRGSTIYASLDVSEACESSHEQ